jgi:hypothetical protein
LEHVPILHYPIFRSFFKNSPLVLLACLEFLLFFIDNYYYYYYYDWTTKADRRAAAGRQRLTKFYLVEAISFTFCVYFTLLRDSYETNIDIRVVCGSCYMHILCMVWILKVLDDINGDAKRSSEIKIGIHQLQRTNRTQGC